MGHPNKERQGADQSDPKRDRAGQSGFTLVELLVVLVIVGLLVTVAPVALQRAVPSLQEKATAQEMVDALGRTRARAIGRNEEQVFLIDLENMTYRIGETGPTKEIEGNFEIQLRVASSEQRAENIAGIRFFPDGTSTGGRVTLNSANRSFGLQVDWLTGAVSVHDPEDEDLADSL